MGALREEPGEEPASPARLVRTRAQPLETDMAAALRLAWPNLLASIVQTIVGWFVLKHVGLLGSVEIAAYGLGRTIVMWAGSAYWSLNVGVMALVARQVGRGAPREAGSTLIQGLHLAFALTIPTSLVGIALSPSLLSWFGGAPAVVRSGTQFLQLYMVAMIFMVMWFLGTSTLRSSGETQKAMYLEWSANIVQAVLTYALVLGPGTLPSLGLVGAAWALLVSRVYGFVAAIWVVGKHSSVSVPSFSWQNWRPHSPTIKRIALLSYPASIDGLARTSGVLALLTLVSTAGGTAAVSGYTIGIQLEPLLRMIADGLGVAATAMVGQNLGAGYRDEAEKGAWNAIRLALYAAGAIGAVFLLIPNQIVGFFTGDSAAIFYGAAYLRAVGVASLGMGVTMAVAGGFRGAGDARTPMLTTIAGFWLVQIPLGYILSRHTVLGATGVFWGIAAGWVVQGVYIANRFRRGGWKWLSI